MKKNKGFTLIEVVIVVSIIGILAAIAVPHFTTYRSRSLYCEGMALLEPVKENVLDYFDYTGVFPKDNFESGLPKPELIRGKYVESITVTNGSITIKYNERAGGFSGKSVSLIPQINRKKSADTVIWKEENEGNKMDQMRRTLASERRLRE